MNYLGDFRTGQTVRLPFHTFNSSGGSVTLTGFAASDVLIYKNGSTTERASSSGITVTTDFDSKTGLHYISIDLSDNADAGFYAAANDYTVAVADITVDGQTVRLWAGTFSIENRNAAFDLGLLQESIRLGSGVTDQYVYFKAVNSSDYKSLKTGLTTFTVYRSRNGSAAVAYTTPTITEISAANMPGLYKFLLDEDMTIDAGDYTQQMVYHITATGMLPVTIFIELFRRDVDAPTKGVALSDIPVYLVLSTDHVTAATGKSVTAEVSKNAAAFAAAAGTVAEVGSGVYQFDASAADMNGDVLLFKFTATGCDPFLAAIKTVP